MHMNIEQTTRGNEKINLIRIVNLRLRPPVAYLNIVLHMQIIYYVWLS